MERVSKLGLEAIQLEDQVLLVEKSVISVGDYITDSLRVWRWNDDCSLLGRKKVISSTKPLEGLPLLVIEDEADEISEKANGYALYGKPLGEKYLAFKEGFKEGHNKARQTYKFTEEDLRNVLSESFKASQEGYQITSDEIIQSLTKKELWIEVEEWSLAENVEAKNQNVPKITNNQIKAVWK